MMKNNYFILAMVLTLGIGIILTGAVSTFAADMAAPAHLVVIKSVDEYGKAKLVPTPATMEATRGEIAVWMNLVTDKEVKVIFEEGKTCRDVTKNLNLRQLGFLLDTKGCYSTSFVNFSETTSLQFTEPGKFSYKVISEDGLEGMGKIIVK